MPITDEQVYHRLGEAGFEQLTAAFYARVVTDDRIGPLYPPDDLLAAQERLRDFLIQRFGGPTRYSEQRGHPRLRMRHLPFSIGPAERDRWLELMRAAMEECEIDAEVSAVLWPYFEHTANFMMNRE